MTGRNDLREAVEDLRARQFVDLPRELVESILDIETAHVDDRDVAVDAVRAAIQEEARERAEQDVEDEQ